MDYKEAEKQAERILVDDDEAITNAILKAWKEGYQRGYAFAVEERIQIQRLGWGAGYVE